MIDITYCIGDRDKNGQASPICHSCFRFLPKHKFEASAKIAMMAWYTEKGNRCVYFVPIEKKA